MARGFLALVDRTRAGRLVRLLFACLAGCLLVTPGARAADSRPLYVVAVGHNAVADVLKRDGGGLVTLRYADDDALKVYSLLRHASRRAFLLAVLDSDTQRRFPDVARLAVPPTLAELNRVVEVVTAGMLRDRAMGQEPELVFFFSGHGVRGENGGASLSLLDGVLTRSWLHETLLARVPARHVHLIIDACHAEAVVRPRDVNAAIEPLDEQEQKAYLDSATLDRFPNVGAVLASTAGAQSFEWDAYRSGVFAHQLLSGLRGGADVNGDGRVEYSEIAAFLSAANLHVSDPRARLDIVVRPPHVDRRAPLLDLRALARQFVLRGPADGAWARGFFIETEAGERLLDVFPEHAAHLALRLPAGERLYLIRPDAEVKLAAREGGMVAFKSLKARPRRLRARGSLDVALREGLFAARFGPAFYQGYVSQREELVPVPVVSEQANAALYPATIPASPAADPRRTLATVLLVGGGAAAVAAGLFTGLALDAKHDYDRTELERPAANASERFERYETAAWIGGGAAFTLGAIGLTLLAWPSDGDEPAPAIAVDGLGLMTGGTF